MLFYSINPTINGYQTPFRSGEGEGGEKEKWCFTSVIPFGFGSWLSDQIHQTTYARLILHGLTATLPRTGTAYETNLYLGGVDWIS